MENDYLFRLEKEKKVHSESPREEAIEGPDAETGLRSALKREITRLFKAGLLRPGALKDDIPVY